MIPIPTNLERIAAAIEAQTAALDRQTEATLKLAAPPELETQLATERAGKPGFEAWAKLAFPWLGPEGADYRNLRAAYEAGRKEGYLSGSDDAWTVATGGDL